MNGKKIGIIAILGILALCAVGYFIYDKKQNAVGLRVIPISVSGVETDVVERWVSTFQEVLKHDEVLQKIVNDSDYAAKLEIPDGEAVESFRSAVKVSHSTSHRAITVGLSGKLKDSAILDTISRSVFDVVAPIVAAKEPSFGAHLQSLQKAGQ